MMAKRLVDKGLDWRADMYFCSLSGRTIVYKGMTNANVRTRKFFFMFVGSGGIDIVIIGVGAAVAAVAVGCSRRMYDCSPRRGVG